MGFEAKNTDHIVWIEENSVEIRVKHDPTVEYKPGPEVLELVKLSEEIRKLKKSFLEDIYGPKLTALLDKVKEYNYNHHSEVKKQMDFEKEKKEKKESPKKGKIRDFIKKTFKKNKKKK